MNPVATQAVRKPGASDTGDGAAMNPRTLYRISAVSLLASFVLSLAGGVLHPIVDGQSHSVASLLAPMSPGAQMLIYAGAIALMVGLPGAYLWFRPVLGRIGFAGFGLYFLGNALSAQSHLVVEGFVAPAVASDPGARHLVPANGSIIDSPPFLLLQVVGGLVLVAGMLLIGIALLRARGLPTWLGAFLVLGAVATTVPFPEVPGLTGLLIELPRGLTVGVLGVLVLRSLREGRTGAEGTGSTVPGAGVRQDGAHAATSRAAQPAS